MSKNSEEFKKGLCEAVKVVKKAKNLRYSDIEKHGVSKTSLNYILNKGGYQVSTDTIIDLLCNLGYDIQCQVTETHPQ